MRSRWQLLFWPMGSWSCTIVAWERLKPRLKAKIWNTSGCLGSGDFCILFTLGRKRSVWNCQVTVKAKCVCQRKNFAVHWSEATCFPAQAPNEGNCVSIQKQRWLHLMLRMVIRNVVKGGVPQQHFRHSDVRQKQAGQHPCQMWGNLCHVEQFCCQDCSVCVLVELVVVFGLFCQGRASCTDWDVPLPWESSGFPLSNFGLLTNGQPIPLENSYFNLWSSLPYEVRGQSCKNIWLVYEKFSAFYSEKAASCECPDFSAFCLRSCFTASCSRIPS